MRHFIWLAGLSVFVGCDLQGQGGPKDDEDEPGENDPGDVHTGGDDSSPGDDTGDSEGPPPPTWTVCTDGADFPTIQAAIDAAVDGDVVSICPGTWHEHLVIAGKSIALVARDGADTVEVAGDAAGTVLTVTDAAAGVRVEGLALVGGSAALGAGVHCENASLKLTDVRVADNHADEGGGGLYATACTLDVTGARFEGNEAWGDGGGALLVGSGGSVKTSVFVGNNGDNGGGLLATEGDVTIEGSEFTGNTAFNGGGIWLDGGSSVTSTTVTENTTTYNGGGIYIMTGSGNFTDNEVSRNVGSEGAGFYFYECTAYFARNLMEENDAWEDDAGGARIYYSNMVIEDNVFRANHAADGGAGAKISHGTSTVTGNLLEENVADWNGGGFEIDDDNSDVSDNVFYRNHANSGGGLHYNEPFWHVVADGNWFEGNVAESGGGAVSLEENTEDDMVDGPGEVYYSLTVRHTVAIGNQAESGGALYTDYSTLNVENSILAGNEADWGGGAAWYNATGHVENVVAYGNVASHGGGFGVSWGFPVDVVNTVVSKNEGGAVWTESSPAPTFQYSNIWSNTGGDDVAGATGNISGDPKFVDPATWDFHLAAGSPCIDGGDPNDYDADASRSDIGAFGGSLGDWEP